MHTNPTFKSMNEIESIFRFTRKIVYAKYKFSALGIYFNQT